MVIESKGLTKIINGTTVLEDISLRFEGGNIYGIMGKNGSGKTMLLRAIAGLIRPTRGDVTVNSKVLHKDISFPPNMGLLIEKPEFLGHLTGFENLKFLAEIKKVISDNQIREYMKMFDLDPDSKKIIRKYSLGMKQKIGIIQAIMEEQELLILDEAFNALDEVTVTKLRHLLLKYKEEGKIIILTSHYKEDIDALCNFTYQISEGRILNQPLGMQQV